MAATEETQQDGSKTLVSFVVGLLIGGMLVWAFSGPNTAPADVVENDETEEVMEEDGMGSEMEEGNTAATSEPTSAPAPTLPVGDGSVVVNDQPASASVSLERATYPIEEGWIGVRDYNNGQLGFIKGVVRFSAAAGVVPENIILQDSTRAGQQYAVVVFSDNGDNAFNPAGDVQIDQIFATFTAQ